jgi:hypothetical protein
MFPAFLLVISICVLSARGKAILSFLDYFVPLERAH